MKFNDATSGVILLALSLAVIAHSWGFPPMPGQFVGPGLFPILTATALAVGSVILIFRGWRMRATVPWFRLDDWTRQPILFARFAAIPLFVLVYVLLSEPVGFVPLSFIGLGLLFLIAGVRWAVAVPVSAVTTAAVYYAFAVILRVPLPRIEVLGIDAWGLPF